MFFHDKCNFVVNNKSVYNLSWKALHTQFYIESKISTGCYIVRGILQKKSAVLFQKRRENLPNRRTDNVIYRVASILKISQKWKYNIFTFHNSQEFIGLLILRNIIIKWNLCQWRLNCKLERLRGEKLYNKDEKSLDSTKVLNMRLNK